MSGVGVGRTVKVSSCTKPPVIEPILTLSNHPNLFHIKINILSAPAYRAHALAAQYACTRPLLNGNNLDKTC